MNIVNVGYDSTNYYAIDIKGGKLLVDCGMPGSYPKLLAELKRKGIGPKDIRYLLLTHFHPDHAGIAQEIKNGGARLLLMESQLDFIAPMAEMLKRKGMPYAALNKTGTVLLSFNESRKFLLDLGLRGEILPTPGHSEDSVTLILDEGLVFIGDLKPEFMLPEDDAVSHQSWKRIREHRVKRIYPAHGEMLEI
jgi:glyoxylase-like metal-dependent hydrolase (beta-lactamase superfamily II)